MSDQDVSIAEEFTRALKIAAGIEEQEVKPPRMIWKFGAKGWPAFSHMNASPEEEIRATVPPGSRFLAFRFQPDQIGGFVPTVWMEVPEVMPSEREKSAVVRVFALVQAGQRVPEKGVYRGMDLDGPSAFVLHAYEIAPPGDDA